MSTMMFLLSVLLACCATVSAFCTDDYSRKDCTEVMANENGYDIKSGPQNLLIGDGRRSKHVYCDMYTNGGGWTVIQKRTSGTLSFYQNWDAYEKGFGIITGDHWIGLQALHSITVNKRYLLRIEFTDWNGIVHYAEYDDFRIGGVGCNYTLESLGAYCGDCGDSLKGHLGAEFSTYDRDNDNAPGASCAVKHHGAWWYKACHVSNLNGDYKFSPTFTTDADGIVWSSCGGFKYSYKSTKMMIRSYYF